MNGFSKILMWCKEYVRIGWSGSSQVAGERVNKAPEPYEQIFYVVDEAPKNGQYTPLYTPIVYGVSTSA